MVTATLIGHCSQCGKSWTLDTKHGLCQWCGKRSTYQPRSTQPLRGIKSSRRRGRGKYPEHGKGYEQLPQPWVLFYNVASRFNHKAKEEDTEDLLHDIIVTLADVERNNGHKPLTEPMMYRIASYTQAHYWYKHYTLTNGLDCRHCSRCQRAKCKEDYLYTECPKAIKLESLNKPIIDSEGNLTELGNLIADDKALDLDAWLDAKTFLLGSPQRLKAIAVLLRDGIPLEAKDKMYLQRFRQREQKKLF